jgi:hypothetical protein
MTISSPPRLLTIFRIFTRQSLHLVAPGVRAVGLNFNLHCAHTRKRQSMHSSHREALNSFWHLIQAALSCDILKPQNGKSAGSFIGASRD